MTSYRYSILLNAVLVTGMISGANVSCNERMRHGPKGLFKGACALVGGAATVYMLKELKEAVGPFRTPRAYVSDGKRQEALQNSLFTGCALIALGYVTWKLTASSIESLKIYFDDSEDPHIGVKKVVEETQEEPKPIEVLSTTEAS